MAPAVKLDPNELVRVNFIDTAGNRHNDVAMPRHMISGGSVAAKERWLISHGEIADPSAPLVELQESAEIVSAVIDTAALSAVEARIQALEQRPEAQELPTHDSLERLAISVQRAAISKAEIVAVADEATARIDAVASDIEVRQNGFAALIDGGMRQMADAISSFMEKGSVYLADLGQNFALFLDEQGQVVVRVATDVATKVATAVARAEAAKHWGSSLTFCAEDPSKTDHASFAKRWYGRDFLIEGDGCGQTTDSGLIIWRFAGGNWRKSSELVEKTALVNQSLSVLDKSTQVTASMVTTVGGGGGLGGGGGESLLSRTVASGGGAMLSESARWAIPLAAAGLPAPDACTITLELTAADGGNAGRKLFITGKAIYEGLATPPGSFTVYSELGELVGKVDVEFSIQSVPVTALPPGVPAATLPPGVLSAQVFARITSNSSGATQFLLAGAVSWLQPNAVIPADSTTLPQIRPAWGLI